MRTLKFPNFRQSTEYDCGATAMQAVLAYYGHDVRLEAVQKAAGTNKTGTRIKGLIQAARKYGLKAEAKTMTATELQRYIDRGIPVILPVQAWPTKKIITWKNEWKYGHYVIGIGYNTQRIYFEDPSSITRTYLTYKELEERWHDQSYEGVRYEHIGIAIEGNRRGRYDPDKVIHMD